MPLEMELKYLDVDFEALRRRLMEKGGETTGPYLETNLVFDDAGRSLKQKGTLLRLRRRNGEAVLTVKEEPDDPFPSSLKVFQEIESMVGDFDAVKAALEAVGFVVAFAYEKVREKWRFMECQVCLDHLPFGDFVEIEGAEDAIERCAEDLALGAVKTTKSTYHALNMDYRFKKGLGLDENFLFSDEERIKIIHQLGKD